MICLAFDPGVNTGWSLIRYNGGTPIASNSEVLASGVFRVAEDDPFALLMEVEHLRSVVMDHGEDPGCVVIGVENQYLDLGKNTKKGGSNFQNMKTVIVIVGYLLMAISIVFRVQPWRPYPSSWQSDFGIKGPRAERKKQARQKVQTLYNRKAKQDEADAILMSVHLAMRYPLE